MTVPASPRKIRDERRIQVTYLDAYRNAKDPKKAAWEATLAQAEAISPGNPQTRISLFKQGIESIVRHGTGHPGAVARYGARAKMLRGLPLGKAIAVTEGWYRDELRQHKTAPPYATLSHLSLSVLSELRLLLRMIRASGRSILGAKSKEPAFAEHFDAILALLLNPISIAA